MMEINQFTIREGCRRLCGGNFIPFEFQSYESRKCELISAETGSHYLTIKLLMDNGIETMALKLKRTPSRGRRN
jgi:hypothetical protein